MFLNHYFKQFSVALIQINHFQLFRFNPIIYYDKSVDKSPSSPYLLNLHDNVWGNSADVTGWVFSSFVASRRSIVKIMDLTYIILMWRSVG